MVEVDHLTKFYGGFAAIRDVSFTAEQGQILGFLGPNGAGKTTTMRIITGYIPAHGGTARVAGFDVFEDSKEVRRRIGYLPENPPLYEEMTPTSYLDFVSRIKGVDRASRRDAVQRALEVTMTTDVAQQPIGTLSRGYKQRVAIGQALVHDPEVLVLDEPTIGLDPQQINQIRKLITELAGDRTVILSTHILPEVTQICDKVVIIADGSIVAEDQLDSLTATEDLEAVFLRVTAGDRPAADGDGAPAEPASDAEIGIAPAATEATDGSDIATDESDAAAAEDPSDESPADESDPR